jgi:hypothetical protein
MTVRGSTRILAEALHMLDLACAITFKELPSYWLPLEHHLALH